MAQKLVALRLTHVKLLAIYVFAMHLETLIFFIFQAFLLKFFSGVLSDPIGFESCEN